MGPYKTAPRAGAACMRRRAFLGIVGGVAAWPVVASAQQPGAVRHVGVFLGLSKGPEDPGTGEILRPFRSAMQQAGWIEGKSVNFDVRYGGGDIARMATAADELVARAPQLIYATGLPSVQALRQRTRTIPIVFSLVADPVGFGLVQSLNHPGGNITGFVVWDLSIGGKWVQLLQEIAPDLTRIGIMYNPDTAPYAQPLIASAKASARNTNIIELRVHNDGELEAAIASLADDPRGGLLIIPEPFTNANRDKIMAQVERFKIAALNPVFGAVDRGALISYTYAFDAMMRESATYANRILRGELPRDLPVQAPTKYVLAINLKVAKALGLSVPATLLAVADQVIE
jgi:putative ABC transport system substrate-binding protein